MSERDCTQAPRSASSRDFVKMRDPPASRFSGHLQPVDELKVAARRNALLDEPIESMPFGRIDLHLPVQPVFHRGGGVILPIRAFP